VRLSPPGISPRIQDGLGSKEVGLEMEKQISGMCFQTKESNLPVCGVHQVALVEDRIFIDPNAPGLGRVTCYVCPVGKTVVR
jgi:hypothetical protein